jgi:hypothetical protein
MRKYGICERGKIVATIIVMIFYNLLPLLDNNLLSSFLSFFPPCFLTFLCFGRIRLSMDGFGRMASTIQYWVRAESGACWDPTRGGVHRRRTRLILQHVGW